MSSRRYSVYGLVVDSEIELPELEDASGIADVRIRVERIEPELPSPSFKSSWFATDGHAVLITAAGIARYLIRDGREILVEPLGVAGRGGASSADVRLYLLGGVFGALLHQRGWLPLHVSAVQVAGEVWAFTGESGAGKSTLAAWLHRKMGFALVSDDVSVIREDASEVLLFPGPRKIKLWTDAVDYFECRNESLVQDLSNTEKYQLYLNAPSGYCPGRMRALIVLVDAAPGEPPGLRRLRGGSAFAAFKDAVYRPEIGSHLQDGSSVMRLLALLCRDVEVYEFCRRRTFDDFAGVHAELLALMTAARQVEVL